MSAPSRWRNVDRHPVDVPAVQEEQGAVLDVSRGLVEDVRERKEAVLEGERELLSVEEHHRVLPELGQDSVGRQERAECIPVRPLVGRKEKSVPVRDRRSDRLEVRADGFRGGGHSSISL